MDYKGKYRCKVLIFLDKLKNYEYRKHKGILLKQVNYVVNKVLIHQDGGFDIVV